MMTTTKPNFSTLNPSEPLSFEELASLTNEELDNALTVICFERFEEESRVAGDLWAERTRRIRRAERENLEAAERDFDFDEEPATDPAVERRAAAFIAKHGDTESMEAAAWVDCPHCGAARGSKCKGGHGQTMSRRVHTERVRANAARVRAL